MCACHESPTETSSAEKTARKNTVPAPLDNPPAVSAEQLHTILLKAFKVGALSRRKFLQALLAMDSSRLYLQLGFSSIAQYVEKHFGCQHTQTYDLLRVAAALRELPLCDLAFKEGRLSWSSLREITKVATVESERDWLKFASSHTFAQLHAEVKDAQKKGGRSPARTASASPTSP